jgi:hypothetical protein
MAKKQDFASKVAKAQKSGESCPECGDVFSFVKKEQAYFSESTQSWKYETRNHKVCKCNENDIYN